LGGGGWRNIFQGKQVPWKHVSIFILIVTSYIVIVDLCMYLDYFTSVACLLSVYVSSQNVSCLNLQRL